MANFLKEMDEEEELIEPGHEEQFIPETVIKEDGGVDVTLDMVGGDYIQKNISVKYI